MRLTDEQRKEICEFALANPNITQNIIATRFGLDRSTVSKILARAENWIGRPITSGKKFVSASQYIMFMRVDFTTIHSQNGKNIER